jgi:hypothetical protein
VGTRWGVGVWRHMYKLNGSIPAIESVGGHRTAIMIPEGALVRVISPPLPYSRMVDILWDGRTLAVFLEVLTERSVEVGSAAN